MKWIFLLLVGLVAVACSHRDNCALCGSWRSDAAASLAEVEASGVLSPEEKARYRNNFFGRLTVEFTRTETRSYFPEESPESAHWWPYEVVDGRGNTIVITYLNPSTGQREERTYLVAGNCYRVVQPGRGYAEHFCRVPGA